MTRQSDTSERPTGPRKATARHLENAALYYLARREAPRAHLRRLLMRRVERSAKVHGTDPEEGEAQVDRILARLEGDGFLDDARYAAGRARGLFRRGASKAKIAAKLKEKGVGEETVAGALDDLHAEAEDPEFAAAVALARRRGLGPYRSDPESRADNRRRDLAVMGRNGFAYPVARRVIDAEEPDSLEDET